MEKNISENQLLNERGYKTKRKEVCVRRHASSKKKKHTKTQKSQYRHGIKPQFFLTFSAIRLGMEMTPVFFDVFRDKVG